MSVGDVESQDAARSKVAAVKRQGLRGQKVDGDGVAGEGVDYQDIEVLWRFTGQRCAGVAFYDLDLGSGLSDVREGVLRDRRDGGVIS